MKKTVLILAAAYVAVACSGKSAAPATEAVEETQEVQIEAIDSTAVEIKAQAFKADTTFCRQTAFYVRARHRQNH